LPQLLLPNIMVEIMDNSLEKVEIQLVEEYHSQNYLSKPPILGQFGPLLEIATISSIFILFSFILCKVSMKI
jgi:hypothetical protein